MRYFIPTVLVVVLFSASASFGSSAELYFQRGDWQKAIAEYKDLSSKEPTVHNLNRLADAYFYSDNYAEAYDAYVRAMAVAENADSAIALALLDALADRAALGALMGMIETYDEYPRLWRSIGIFYIVNKQEDKALYYFGVAVEKDRKDYLSYYYSGLAYERHHEYDEAIRPYKKAVELNPNFAPAVNNLGYNYKEKAYYTYAIDMYRKAVELMPDNAGYHYNIGNAYTHKGMYEEAFGSYKRAVELDPLFAKAHYNLGRTHIRFGRFEEAMSELRLYIKLWDASISESDAPPPDAVREMIKDLEAIIEEEKSGEGEDNRDM